MTADPRLIPPRECEYTLRRTGQDIQKKPLPRTQSLGRVPINFVKVYDKRLVLKAAAANDGDDPELFIDLESPRPEYTQQNGLELHLGVSANFWVESRRNSQVKPHIDIYIPASEIPRLAEILRGGGADAR